MSDRQRVCPFSSGTKLQCTFSRVSQIPRTSPGAPSASSWRPSNRVFSGGGGGGGGSRSPGRPHLLHSKRLFPRLSDVHSQRAGSRSGLGCGALVALASVTALGFFPACGDRGGSVKGG